MVGGAIASFMGACVVGVLIGSPELVQVRADHDHPGTPVARTEDAAAHLAGLAATEPHTWAQAVAGRLVARVRSAR